MNSTARKVFKNTGLLYLRMAITVSISLYSTRLVLASLGAEDFGIFNVVAGAIAMLTFLNTAMASSTQRFMSHAEGKRNLILLKKVFNVSLVLHIAIAFILLILLEISGFVLFNHVLKISEERMHVAKLIYQCAIISIFFTIISVPYDALINANENMLFVAITGIIESVLKLVIAVYLSVTSLDKLFAFGILMSIIPILIFLCNLFYCAKYYSEAKINLGLYFDKPIFLEMGKFTGWNFLTSSTSLISMQGVTVLLNSFFGVTVNAAQSISNQLSGQLMAFSTTMLKALNPALVKSEARDERNQMIRFAIAGNKFSFFLLSLFAIPTIIEMPFILNLWLKDVPQFAIIFGRLTLFRLLISQLATTLPTIIGATGKIKSYVKTESLIYLVLLPVSYMMFKFNFSPEYIYVNLLVMAIALVLSRIYFAKRECSIDTKEFYAESIHPCLYVFTVSFIISSFPSVLFSQTFWRCCTTCVISLSVTILTIYSKGLNLDEKSSVKFLAIQLKHRINEKYTRLLSVKQN